MPAVGRKNYYGTHSFWGGELLTICMSLFETGNDHGIDPVTYLRIYFDACCKAKGLVPDNLENYLPWNISPETIQEYHNRDKEKNP